MKVNDVKVCGVTANSEPSGGGGGTSSSFTASDLVTVKEELTRLKELNQEMVEMIKELLYEEQYGTTHKAVKLLAKAEEAE